MRAAKGHWQLLLVADSAGISENDRCTYCNRLYTSCITSQSLSLKIHPLEVLLPCRTKLTRGLPDIKPQTNY